ncbi:hypothetical protein DFS34DRAFT_629977 [Phlyctochytrium arcticum]|nr:hypothetical protein DFS34DRAFT_629977 [Phlyctochytrium arcticum]
MSDNKSASANPMTTSDASRIQSSQAKSGANMTSSGFSARAQAAGAKNSTSAASGAKDKK